MKKADLRVVFPSGGLVGDAAAAGIVVAVLFLIFGVGFMVFVFGETPDSEGALRLFQIGFGAIWVVACLAIISIYARLLRNRAKASSTPLLGVEGTLDDDETPAAPGADFAERMRKVEALYRDGLLTKAEYRSKRDEIMNEKW